MKGYSKIIPIDLYCRDILFVFGDKEYLKKSVRRYHNQEQTEKICDFEVTANSKGRAIYSEEHNAFVVWYPQLPTTAEDFGFFSHEIFHAAHALMISIGANLSDDSEEAYAYLIGYLTKRVLETFPISFVRGGSESVSKQTQPPS